MFLNSSNSTLLSFPEAVIAVFFLVSSAYVLLIRRNNLEAVNVGQNNYQVKPEGELKSSFEYIAAIGLVSYTVAVITGKDLLVGVYDYFKNPNTQTATKGDVQALSTDLMASLIESNNAILQSQANMQVLFLLTSTITAGMLFVCLIGAWQLYKRQAFLLSMMQSRQEARNREAEVPVRTASSKQSRQSIPSNAYERWLQAELAKVNKEGQHMESSIVGLFTSAAALASKIFSYKATIGLMGVFFGAAGTTWYAAEALKDLPATNKKIDLMFEELTEIRKAIAASVHVSTETIKEHEIINSSLKGFADIYEKNSKLLYEKLTAQFGTSLDTYSAGLMNAMNKLNHNFMNTANVLQAYMKSIDEKLKFLVADISKMKAKADVPDRTNEDNDPDSFAGAVPASNGIPTAVDPLTKSNLVESMKEGKEEEVEQIAKRLLNPEVVANPNTERLIEANAVAQQQETVIVNAVTASQNSMDVEREEISFFDFEELDPCLVEGVTTAIDTTVGLPVSSALVSAAQLVSRDIETSSNAMEIANQVVSFPKPNSQSGFLSMSHFFQSQLDRTSIVYSGAGITALQEQQNVLEQAINRVSANVPEIEGPNKYKAFIGGVIRHPFATFAVGIGVKTGIVALGGPAVFSYFAGATIVGYMSWFGNSFLKAHATGSKITSGLDDDE